mgnify:CR=1 FL=1
MKIAVIGATGWIGSTLVAEATSRGHSVIAIARDTAKLGANGLDNRPLDLSNGDLAAAVAGADVVIASIGGRAAGNHDIVTAAAQRLLDELPTLGIRRHGLVSAGDCLLERRLQRGVDDPLPDLRAGFGQGVAQLDKMLAIPRHPADFVQAGFIILGKNLKLALRQNRPGIDAAIY